MEGRYCVIIFFVVIGINAIYSLPHQSNLAADVDSREGHNDLDSNVDLFDEVADGRFKRDRAHDYNERQKRINKNERILNRRINARNEQTTKNPTQVFGQHIQGTIEQLMREDRPAPVAMRHNQNERHRN